MKIFNKIAFATILFFASASCNVLDQEPISSIASVTFYQTASDVEAAVIACYDGFQSSYNRDIVLVSSVMSDEGFPISGGNYISHNDFNPSATQGNVQDFWQAIYRTVTRCNDVLENIDKVTDPAISNKRDQLRGEALFLRSLSFFFASRYWGDIPLPLETVKSLNQDYQIPRTPAIQVLDQVVKDLQASINFLPIKQPNKYRATKAAAQGMLAKILMWRKSAGDDQLALKNCEDVMADTQYSLVSRTNYLTMFELGKQNTSESLFEISYRPNTAQEANDLDYELVPAVGNRYRIRPSDKLFNALKENPLDVRGTVVDSYNKKNYVKKYMAGAVDATTNRGLQHNNVIYLRLADVILMRAELLNETGKTTEAIGLLNQIRQRAGISNTVAVSQAEVRTAIAQERFLELCFESNRWFDLVRTGKAQENCPKLKDVRRILWPIPQRDIDLNKNLTQNASY